MEELTESERLIQEYYEAKAKANEKIQEKGQVDTVVICQIMKKMADKHNVEIEALNIHATYGQIHIQEYRPGERNEFRCLETLDMEGI